MLSDALFVVQKDQSPTDGVLSVSYQKIMLSTTKTTATIQAQKIGFCQILVAPSSGITVAP
jgi:hypothetical protein